MINLLKSDLYRLFRSKTYRNCAIGSGIVALFVLVISIFTNTNLWLMAFMGSDETRRGFNIFLEQGATLKQLIVNAFGSGAGLYIIGITLTSSVVISKNRSGIMKATVSYGYERWKIYVSQLITLIIGIAILIIGSFISILLITSLVFKQSIFNLEALFLITKSLTLYIVIVAATVSIYTFLSTLISNSEVIAVVAIGEMMGFAMLGPSLPMAVNNFIPYSMIRTVAQIPEAVDFIVYAVNSGLIILVVTFLGIMIFNKKEIK